MKKLLTLIPLLLIGGCGYSFPEAGTAEFSEFVVIALAAILLTAFGRAMVIRNREGRD